MGAIAVPGRREAIACGLNDRHAIGGGDSAMLCAGKDETNFPKALNMELYVRPIIAIGRPAVKRRLFDSEVVPILALHDI